MNGDCRSEEGVIVGLIDGVIAQARIVARYLRANSPTGDVAEALHDLRADDDVAFIARGGRSTLQLDAIAARARGDFDAERKALDSLAVDERSGPPTQEDRNG